MQGRNEGEGERRSLLIGRTFVDDDGADNITVSSGVVNFIVFLTTE